MRSNGNRWNVNEMMKKQIIKCLRQINKLRKRHEGIISFWDIGLLFIPKATIREVSEVPNSGSLLGISYVENYV